jgi:hypothetical protein
VIKGLFAEKYSKSGWFYPALILTVLVLVYAGICIQYFYPGAASAPPVVGPFVESWQAQRAVAQLPPAGTTPTGASGAVGTVG